MALKAVDAQIVFEEGEMLPDGRIDDDRRQARREMLRQYVRLQRDLVEADPASSAYKSIIHAFRQMGFVLITSGLEDDLDRLLRLRVLEGGRRDRKPRGKRPVPDGLTVLEQKPG